MKKIKAFWGYRVKNRQESVLALSSIFSISSKTKKLKNPWSEKRIKEKFWF